MMSEDIKFILSRKRETSNGVKYAVANPEERDRLISIFRRVYENNCEIYERSIIIDQKLVDI